MTGNISFSINCTLNIIHIYCALKSTQKHWLDPILYSLIQSQTTIEQLSYIFTVFASDSLILALTIVVVFIVYYYNFLAFAQLLEAKGFWLFLCNFR